MWHQCQNLPRAAGGTFSPGWLWSESAPHRLRWDSPAPPWCHHHLPSGAHSLQALLKEASAHGEQLAGLEAVAARLRDFSRRQDGAVIQNLLLSARERLGKVLQRAAERGAQLEDARKRAKQVPGMQCQGCDARDVGPSGAAQVQHRDHR